MTELLADTAEAELAGAGGGVGEVGKAATEAVPDDVSRCIGAVACAGCPLAQFCPKVPIPEVSEQIAVEEGFAELEGAPRDELAAQPAPLRLPRPLVHAVEVAPPPTTPEQKNRPYLDLLMDDTVLEVRVQLVEEVVLGDGHSSAMIEGSGESVYEDAVEAEMIIEKPLDVAPPSSAVVATKPYIAPSLPRETVPVLHVAPTLDIAYDTPDVGADGLGAVVDVPDIPGTHELPEVSVVDGRRPREHFEEFAELPGVGSNESIEVSVGDDISDDGDTFTEPAVRELLVDFVLSDKPELVVDGLPVVADVALEPIIATTETDDFWTLDKVQDDWSTESPEGDAVLNEKLPDTSEGEMIGDIFLDDTVFEIDTSEEPCNSPELALCHPISERAAVAVSAMLTDEVLSADAPIEEFALDDELFCVDDIQDIAKSVSRHPRIKPEFSEYELPDARAAEEAFSESVPPSALGATPAAWLKGDVSHRLALVVLGLIGLRWQHTKIYSPF